jgi:hypothetical protein
VQAGQQVRGLQHVGVILAGDHRGALDGLLHELAGTVEVASITAS